MKLLTATIVIAGLTLALGACNKTGSNSADENAVNAAAPDAYGPQSNATANDVDNNSAADNQDGNGTRTDGGPRG